MRDDRSGTVELACLDMAGTTVRDDGAVEGAFTRVLDEMGVGDAQRRIEALTFVRATMGRSKIEVFSDLFGSEAQALRANDLFEKAFAEFIEKGRVEAVSGALEVMRCLRVKGCSVVLTTGFSPSTRDLLIDRLGWWAEIDGALSPADSGRGRPHPDMVLDAARRASVKDPGRIAVVGDTRADMESGVAARVGWVVGVLTGSDDRKALESAGATDVVTSVADLLGVLGLDRDRRSEDP